MTIFGCDLGTTLVSVMVHMIKNNADPKCLLDAPIEDSVVMMEMCVPDAPVGTRPIDRLNRRLPPRTCATHLGFSALPESIREKAKVCQAEIIFQIFHVLSYCTVISPTVGFDRHKIFKTGLKNDNNHFARRT